MPEDATLAEEQTALLAAAVMSRQSQLRRWLQWHAGALQPRRQQQDCEGYEQSIETEDPCLEAM